VIAANLELLERACQARTVVAKIRRTGVEERGPRRGRDAAIAGLRVPPAAEPVTFDPGMLIRSMSDMLRDTLRGAGGADDASAG